MNIPSIAIFFIGLSLLIYGIISLNSMIDDYLKTLSTEMYNNVYKIKVNADIFIGIGFGLIVLSMIIKRREQ
jgi:hypothetical protein